jgi:hypothetical protein
MNAKLIQLAQQAHLYNADDNFLTAAVEELARLIIEEATDLVGTMLDQDTAGEVVVEIKQHFGVL